MSGPKISDYSLEGLYYRYLRSVEEEKLHRRENERREVQRWEKRRNDKQIIDNCKEVCSQLMEEMRAKWEIACDRLSAMSIQCETTAFDNMEQTVSKFLEKYENSAELVKAQENCAAVCQTDLAAVRLSGKAVQQAIQDLDTVVKAENQRIAAELYQKVLQKKQSEEENVARLESQAALEVFEDAVKELAVLEEDLPVSLKGEASELREQLDQINHSFSQSPGQVKRLVHDFRLFGLSPFRKKVERWKSAADARREYAALCELLEQPVPEHIDSMAQAELEAECKKLSETLMERRARTYMLEAVQECMNEMGYTLSGQISRGYSQEMLYQVHDDTVLHVSCGAGGTIAMEIGLASDRERELEMSEMDRLVDDMTTFCTQYPEIQRKLKEKHIELKQDICLLPPSREYAQIIQTSAYGVSAGDLAADRGEKHRVQEQKTMNME